MNKAPDWLIGSASLPSWSLTTLPPGGISLTILNVNQNKSPRCTSGRVYLFTEGYFQYTFVQIYFVEFLYSEEKGTFRLMKGKKLKITVILSFSSCRFMTSSIHR